MNLNGSLSKELFRRLRFHLGALQHFWPPSKACFAGLDRRFPVSGPIRIKEGHRPVFAPLRVAVFLLPWGAVFGVDDSLKLWIYTVKL